MSKGSVEARGLQLYGALLVAVAAVWVAFGWHLFEFSPDDAFISYRYASNLLAGHGLVWNPPPFDPVEGYTSFSWTVLLAAVWWAPGVEPTESATGLSLLFGYATLAVFLVWLRGITARAQRPGYGWFVFTVCLIGVVFNRTVLTWMSSALETSLMNFLLVLWLWLIFRLREDASAFPTGRAAALSGVTSGLALTRPDGLLYAAGCGVIVVALWWRGAPRARWTSLLLGLAPLGAIATHLLWRYAYYGFWLPNTYYAKHLAAWPEAGVRYFASFALEYALWAGLLLLAVGVLVFARRIRREPLGVRALGARAIGRGAPLCRALGVLTVLAHLAYYTLSVGGDHFEYRVYAFALPLHWLALAWAALRLEAFGVASAASLAAVCALSLPVPWVHWWQTKNLRSHHAPFAVALAPHFPAFLSGYLDYFDGLQRWLISQAVGTRHHSHRAFAAACMQYHPPREIGAQWRSTPDDAIVSLEGSVGVAGWRFPNIFIVDVFGLNDAVIAHAQLRRWPDRRMMGHDRFSPPGYAECFRGNLLLSDPRRPGPRRLHEDPISYADIARCLATYSAKAGIPYRNAERFLGASATPVADASTQPMARGTGVIVAAASHRGDSLGERGFQR